MKHAVVRCGMFQELLQYDMKRTLLFGATIIAGLTAAQAKQVAAFSFDIKGGQIYEQVSNNRFAVKGNFSPENVDGAVGKALRLDGYTTTVDARINNILSDAPKSTFSVWIAAEAYPIVEIDKRTTEKVAIVDCLNTTSRTGFAFKLGMDGKVEFRTYIGGWDYSIESETLLPLGKWVNLTVTLDKDNRQAIFYMNGNVVGQSRCNGNVSVQSGNLYIGHSQSDRFSGPFRLTSFSGLIDQLSVWDEVKSVDEIKSWEAENPADFSIPESRFADDLLRPRFHGMPGANWTNETHGLTFSDGRYHLFFQKNANGPYMARLHWGHLSSENLIDWKEEPIAIAPGADYDFKGCWSGCVFSDEEITKGRPAALYTGVDYAKAVIALARPVENNLIEWKKEASPIINGRPAGLSDDFRDPYFFRNGNDAYIIVGSAKNGIGTTTLHKYDAGNNTWSNDGRLFFSGRNAAQSGTFWEMPNVTPMGDGRFLFTTTPIGTSNGVHTLYWTGTINSQGQFEPLTNFSLPKNIELISKQGFGLLSPTIYQHNGKTIAMGIVPDKLSSEQNHAMGWAHTYSLPREWTLSENGELIQKPYDGLKNLRSAIKFTKTEFDLNGDLSLSPVKGRCVELLGRFIVGVSPFGFKFFKNETGEARITYFPTSGELEIDFTELNRIPNDNGVYNGVYTCSLPELLPSGSEMKLNVFIDGSILDIFVNDRWATSIRVFPTNEESQVVDAFAEDGNVHVAEISAWELNSKGQSGGIYDIATDEVDPSKIVDVYNIMGICVKKNVLFAEALEGLSNGIYIIGNKKYIVR